MLESVLASMLASTLRQECSHVFKRYCSHLRQVCWWTCLSSVNAVLYSCLDYCNSLLLISRHSILTSFSVFRLAIHSSHTNISLLTFKLLSENLGSLLTPYAAPYLLRSSDKHLLAWPRTSTSIGKRAFSVNPHAVGNSMPLHIGRSPSFASLKQNFLFRSIMKPTWLSLPQIQLWIFVYLFIDWSSLNYLFSSLNIGMQQYCVYYCSHSNTSAIK